MKPVTLAASFKDLYSDSSNFILLISDLLCGVRHLLAEKLMSTIIFFPFICYSVPTHPLRNIKTFSEEVESFQELHGVPDMLKLFHKGYGISN